jgi:excisionase family DNA binding protein
MKLLTTAEVAERLGVHRTRVNVLIKEGRLPAQQFGRAFLIEEKDLKFVEDRKAGRPRKNQHNESDTSTKAVVKAKRTAKVK